MLLLIKIIMECSAKDTRKKNRNIEFQNVQIVYLYFTLNGKVFIIKITEVKTKKCTRVIVLDNSGPYYNCYD